MKIVMTITLTWLAAISFAQQEIKIEDAKDHVGDSVKICSQIYGGRYIKSLKGSPTFLNMGGAYPNALLTIVIWGTSREQFQQPPEDHYKGLQVCVTGRIQVYNGKPQIIVRDPAQLHE